MEEENITKEDKAEQGPQISIALRIFIVVNIILLAGVSAWWIQGFTAQSAMESKREKYEQAQGMAELIAANPAPRETSEPFYETITYVLDATDRNKWVHFSFQSLKQFTADKVAVDSDEWDIVFRRAKILTNGGATGKTGKAEVAITMPETFDAVKSPPEKGYFKDTTTENLAENKNPALDKWYSYDFLSHELRPQGVVYVMKTARGDFVKFQLLSYYCSKLSGCFTIKYAFLKTQESPSATP
ncbi:MAG: HmuY family protein [Nitrospinota bacterium]|nr:HmuY family protein [Nitrospinota bacterium]MDH5755702.1 HmuY family protein [Nitrospinota bacterium]